jgi:hypothetical protein
VSCSALAREADLALAGTATQARRWLLLEHGGPWGREAAVDTELPDVVAAALARFDGRVLLVRRPGRATANGPVAFLATTTEQGGELRRADLERLEDVADLDPAVDGRPLDGSLVLVCTHRRRDPCCARRGVPVLNALRRHVAGELLWRSSHHGGHRFAANVLALPSGVQLGRVEPGHAEIVAATLADGRIPLDHFRGRSLHAPAVQAADAELRRSRRLDRVADVRLIGHEGDVVVLATPSEQVELRVSEETGPVVPASCGAVPEPTVGLRARIVGSHA